ncbi:hypothetical protein IW261DRAFT_1597265 [Armillaria novae-zelandiae]|uniref:Uncharacterized protein n=1 Tax=Armillaria novae-zelandiae TaxID=153914 RepID=A0AA39U630_9AGAR|nr:hypothetical protein IW261DRAFT_1597265 [Armillaria novae-zelandiae]
MLCGLLFFTVLALTAITICDLSEFASVKVPCYCSRIGLEFSFHASRDFELDTSGFGVFLDKIRKKAMKMMAAIFKPALQQLVERVAEIVGEEDEGKINVSASLTQKRTSLGASESCAPQLDGETNGVSLQFPFFVDDDDDDASPPMPLPTIPTPNDTEPNGSVPDASAIATPSYSNTNFGRVHAYR